VKITLIIPTLNSGGAERVISEIANYLIKKNHTVDLITLSAPTATPFYPIDPKINLQQLNLLLPDNPNPVPNPDLNPDINLNHNLNNPSLYSKIKNLIIRIYKLRQTIISCKPDVILSFIDIMNVTTFLATRATNIPVIVAERTDPNIYKIPKFYNWLRTKLYPRSYKVTVQTQSALAYFSQQIQDKAQIIPNYNRINNITNPDSTTNIDSTANPDSAANSNSVANKNITQHPKVIASVGRLEQEKDHATLIRAMPPVIAKYSQLTLQIYGEGSLHNQLQELIDSLQLTDNIKLMGTVQDIQSCLEQADLFVFPSKYEGFPNALLEAMAVGVPCIASRCSGNTELITDNINGRLFEIGDTGTLTDLILKLLADQQTRAAFSAASQQKALSYDPETIFAQWESLLLEACDAANSSCR
jgi:glycosyltransferase involved in cell wall biosynthesis